jgi:hypothetical protein
MVWSFYREPNCAVPVAEITKLQKSALGKRTLVVLDGMERVQRDGSGGPLGTLSADCSGLKVLLQKVVQAPQGLSIVITSRLPLDDLADSDGVGFVETGVDELSCEDARDLLRSLGVKGAPDELDHLLEEHGRHALTVSLLGGLLAEWHQGLVEKSCELPPLTDIPAGTRAQRQAERLKRILIAYESRLTPFEVNLLKAISQAGGGIDADRTRECLAEKGNAVEKPFLHATLSRLSTLHLLRRLDREGASPQFTIHPLVLQYFDFLRVEDAVVSPLEELSDDRSASESLHKSAVTCAAIDPQRRILVTGSRDATIKIWDLDTGELRRTLEGHTDGVETVAVDSTHLLLVSGSRDHTIRGWNLETGEALGTLEEHTGGVNSVVLDSVRGGLVSASADKMIKLWELETGRVRCRLSGHILGVLSVAVDSAKGLLVSGSADHTIKVWDMDVGQLRRTLRGHTSGVCSVAIDAARGLLVSGSNDRTINIWDLQSGELRRSLKAYGSIFSVVVDSARGLLIGGGWEAVVKIWELETGHLRRTLKGHTGKIWCLALDSTSGVIVSGSEDRTVKFWNLETGVLERTIPTPDPSLWSRLKRKVNLNLT